MPASRPDRCRPHPRQDLRPAWILVGTLTAAFLILCLPLGWLPLYASRLPLVGAHVQPFAAARDWVVPLAIGAGFTLSLPFAALVTNRGHGRAMLRPTGGRVLTAFLLLLALPGAILPDGTPLNAAPLWLLAAFGQGSVQFDKIAAVLLALALFYPLTSALIYGTARRWRIPALLALPVGHYLFLILAGGRI